MGSITAEMKLAGARMLAAKKWPYMMAAVLALQPHAVVGCGTMAVTEKGVLIYDPAFVEGQKSAHLAAVLIHEAQHVIRKHHRRARAIPLVNPKLWNLACFPPGTLTPGGVPIEDVGTMARVYDGELVRVGGAFGALEGTPEHPVFAMRRRHKSYPIRTKAPAWTPLCELRVSDYLCVPNLARYGLRGDTEIDLTPYAKTYTDSLGRTGISHRTVTRIALTPRTAWFLGLYAAEGSASPSVRLSLGAHETDVIAHAQEIAREMGYASSVSFNDTNGANMSLGAVVLGRWLHDHVGTKACNKRIPEIILRHRDPAIRKAFLAGLVTGDGSIYQRGNTEWWSFATTSRALQRDVLLLLAQDGMGGHCTAQKPKAGRVIQGRPTFVTSMLYGVTWAPAGPRESERVLNGTLIKSRSNEWRADEHGVWYPIKRIEARPYIGPVYNIANAVPDHTYVAESLLVHNCDLEVNYGMAAAGWDMGKGVLPAQFGLPDGLLAEDYYQRLRAMGAPEPTEPSPMGGWDGSGAGCPVPGEPDLAAAPKAPAQQGPGSNAPGTPPPATPPQGPAPAGLSEAAMDSLAVQVALAIQAQGDAPAGLKRWASDVMAPPKVRWQDKLAKLCRVVAARTRGYGRVSYAHADRRQAGLGYGPGAPILPGHYQPTPRVAVAIDTSGSMSADVIGEAMGEVKRIFEAAGAPVDFLACDAEVHVHKRMRDWREVKNNLVGGGGTSFVPIFEALAALPSGARPEVLITVTDAFGEFPKHPPAGMQVVWLITSGGGPTPWGERVELGE